MNDERWVQLHERFAKRLSDRLAEMSSAIERSQRGDTGARDALLRQFHSLAGIGGTYGYPAITAAALEGERLCANSIEDGRSLTANDLHVMRSLIETIADIHRNGRTEA